MSGVHHDQLRVLGQTAQLFCSSGCHRLRSLNSISRFSHEQTPIKLNTVQMSKKSELIAASLHSLLVEA